MGLSIYRFVIKAELFVPIFKKHLRHQSCTYVAILHSCI